MSKFNIGVDVGGTKINTGLINDQGQVLYLSSTPTRTEAGPSVVLEHIIEEIHLALAQTGHPATDINCLGFGIPGTVNSREGVVLFAPNLRWRNLTFAERIRREFAWPLAIGQDTHAAAWAEFLFGAGAGCQNMACLTIGTGIGCGLVVNQRLYQGSLQYVGEVGHSLVELNGRPCSCGNHGCLEAYASGTAIQKRGLEIIENYSTIVHDPHQGLTTPDILSAAAQGHPQAQQVVAEAAAYLGMGLVNLIHLFGPEKVIISGGLSQAEALIIEPARAFVATRSYATVAQRVQIVKAGLGEYAPMIGAAFLGRDERYEYGE